MENRDYLAFVIKNIKGLRVTERISLLSLVEKEMNPAGSVSSVRGAVEGCFVKNSTVLEDAFRKADEETALMERSGVSFVSVFDSRYPDRLREIYDPPLILYYRGTLPESCERTVGVVGTRYACGTALEAAYDTGFGLGVNGVTVVSGLAAGIDREAHLGNIDAGVKGIAVLGNGIDMVYPVENRKLAYRLLEEGGVIFSEFEPGIRGTKYTFPRRNRIISGISAAVAVIQAPEKSGALITADFAAEQGREVFIHEAGLPFREGKGGLALCMDGAPSFASPVELVREMGWEILSRDYRSENSGADGQNSLAECEIEGLAVNYRGTYFLRNKGSVYA